MGQYSNPWGTPHGGYPPGSPKVRSPWDSAVRLAAVGRTTVGRAFRYFRYCRDFRRIVTVSLAYGLLRRHEQHASFTLYCAF